MQERQAGFQAFEGKIKTPKADKDKVNKNTARWQMPWRALREEHDPEFQRWINSQVETEQQWTQSKEVSIASEWPLRNVSGLEEALSTAMLTCFQQIVGHHIKVEPCRPFKCFPVKLNFNQKTLTSLYFSLRNPQLQLRFQLQIRDQGWLLSLKSDKNIYQWGAVPQNVEG